MATMVESQANEAAAATVGSETAEAGKGTEAAKETASPAVTSGDTAKEIAALRAETAQAREEAERAKRLMVGLATRMGAGQQAAPTVEDDGKAPERLREALETDPESAMDDHFNRRMAPILRDRYEHDASMNQIRERDKLVAKHGEEKYKKYEKEVGEFMGDMSLTTRAAPGAYERAFDFVRLQHLDEEVEAEVAKRMNRDKQITTEGGSSVGTRRPSKAQLSATEREIMTEYGMNEEEWRKYGGGSAMSQGEIE